VDSSQLRMKYDGVLIGRKTLNEDNPRLNIRMGIISRGKIPYRLVLGSPDKMNLDAFIFNDQHSHKTIIISGEKTWQSTSVKTKNFLAMREISVITPGDLNPTDSELDLKQAMEMVYKHNKLPISSVLVEGGGQIFSSFINQKVYDKMTLFITPLLLGDGLPVFNSDCITNVAAATRFNHVKTELLGDQMVFHAEPHLTKEQEATPCLQA